MLEGLLAAFGSMDRTVPFISPILFRSFINASCHFPHGAADGAGRPCGTLCRPADRRKTLVRFTPKGYEACRQCEAALGDYFSSVMARLEPEQLAQMEALRGALMEAILAEKRCAYHQTEGRTKP